MDLQKLTNSVIEISKEAGEIIRQNFGKLNQELIITKGLNDFVTEIDKKSEEHIISRLSSFIPKAGFIAEEGTTNKIGKDYNWIIDPLDGTTNFIHEFYPVAVSIGLEYHNEIILGVVYEIGLSECFYAWKDGGAFLNGKRISISKKDKLQKSLIATGFPYNEFTQLDKYIELLKYLTKHTQGIRRLGSAATDLAYVACGRFDGFYEYDLKPYDVAAGVILVSEAGGNNSDFKGGHDYIYGKEIISTNKNIFTEFKLIVNQFMKV
jgi:myo-inositol-1(or 4)-monophosphatase